MVVQALALSGHPNGASASPVTHHEALLAVSESIAAHRDLAQRLQAVVQFDFVTLILHDPARNVMRRHIFASAQPRAIEVGRELPLEESPGGWVWQTQQPLLFRDVTRDTRFPQVLAYDAGLPTGASGPGRFDRRELYRCRRQGPLNAYG